MEHHEGAADIDLQQYQQYVEWKNNKAKPQYDLRAGPALNRPAEHRFQPYQRPRAQLFQPSPPMVESREVESDSLEFQQRFNRMEELLRHVHNTYVKRVITEMVLMIYQGDREQRVIVITRVPTAG
jgi:hypothetical protein